jgi:uncharacterized delta-60 repeat protein
MKAMPGMRLVILLAALFCAVSRMHAQVPFALDPGFGVDMDRESITALIPLPDGKVLISGRLYFGSSIQQVSLSRLNHDGTRDLSFSEGYGGGDLAAWMDKYYVRSGDIIRRILPDGGVDDDFIGLNSGPYFSSGAGGDFHVYPDGRVLLSGLHLLSDSVREFSGWYNLVWFSNTGYLDTTAHHRRCDGFVDGLMALPDGKFICSGVLTEYEGHTTSNILRVMPDGALDTTFYTGVNWGVAGSFLPLSDGRVYAGGLFRIAGDPDTLRLVRFLPNGSLDPTFHNNQSYWKGALLGSAVNGVYQLAPNKLVVSGYFQYVAGEYRGGICVVDSSGELLDDYFVGAGCGPWNDQGYIQANIGGFVPAPDGSYYIYGSYHGYNDGTTNDPSQRMVSRLYGLDVGVREEPLKASGLQVYPNPAQEWVRLDYSVDRSMVSPVIVVQDVAGRTMTRLDLTDHLGQRVLDTRMWLPGVYTVQLLSGGSRLATEKLVLKP